VPVKASIAFKSSFPLVILLQVKFGISAVTNFLKIGAAAAVPLLGPANTVFALWLIKDIVVSKVPD